MRTPVLAVIEYNYERDGEIIVPAGTKAVGHIRSGDRSGYVDIQFEIDARTGRSKGKRPLASKTRGHIKGLMHRIFDCAMLWEYLPTDRNPMSLVRIEGSSKRRRKPRILTPEEFAILIAAVDREPCHTMVILALCTGVRCSELVALKWSDFDWENLSVYIRRAIVSGRVDDVKTEYSEAPLPLDPALAR